MPLKWKTPFKAIPKSGTEIGHPPHDLNIGSSINNQLKPKDIVVPQHLSIPGLESNKEDTLLTAHIPAEKYTEYLHDDTAEETYNDNFPVEGVFAEKIITCISAFSQLFTATGFFLELFQDLLTYTAFWLIFVKVALSCCFLVAAFKPRSFRHWAFKNCRLLLNEQYIVYIMLILCQTFSFDFVKDRIFNYVGGIFICIAMAIYVIIWIIWAYGRCRRKM